MPLAQRPVTTWSESGLSALQSAGHMPMCRAALLDRAGGRPVFIRADVYTGVPLPAELEDNGDGSVTWMGV
jgi:hypothetical protein